MTAAVASTAGSDGAGSSGDRLPTGQEERSRSTYLSLLAEGLRLTGDKRGAKRLLKTAQSTNPSNSAPPRGGLVVDIADLLSKKASK